ncbi:transferase [Anaerocolumna sedimenticola]|uniref:Transferase n=1 Tax=Anaerocolumna sedimenticola TaxID=2696063 RepID=A0A6P1TSF3_9FIRM|nr:acetyltransferase [Anaerocolumna sedimenticola]QHQ63192.1 transferase [Anaerocolumna sedimenticola]
MKDIVIIGAGGFGKEVAQLIKDINKDKKTWNLLGYIDETVEKHGSLINETPVLGSFDWFEKSSRSKVWAVCALGNPRDKYKLIQKTSAYPINYATIIHPDAKINKYSDLGFGCIICCNSFISVNTKIGNHVCINPGCGIGHDTIIEDYTSLYWNVTLSGNVFIHEGCEIGSKAIVIQKKTVGKWSIIGAGAVIIRDLPEYCTAVGVPGRTIKISEP